MEDSRSRKAVFQNYYTEEDYTEVLVKLPDIIKEVLKKTGEVMEPTINEKKKIMGTINDFIRRKGRKVYGGTAINEALKVKNPDDAIYDEYTFSDVEFYSTTPVVDLVELANELYAKGYKFVVGQEAVHEETYTIFVNFQIYCDITYVPVRIYNGIKTLIIDGINYCDPHFILIDQLRIINQPLTAAEQRWEKTFKRMYKLLKNYPFEYFDKSIKIPKPSDEISSYISKIRNGFMSIKEVQNTCLISGFEAFNFYVKYAAGDKTVKQMARTVKGPNRVSSFVTNVPFIDLISVNYRDTVERLYNFIKENVIDPKNITIEEYYPLFQFTGYSIVFMYNGTQIARVFDADGFCVPNIKTTIGYMYVSYQYILMIMLINKFRAHLDKNREMYFNYSIAISNLVTSRNVFLNREGFGVINESVFSEFRIPCIGKTVNTLRVSKLRNMERYKQGKIPFRYSPDHFFSQSKESQEKFDPTKHMFKNTSGNKILNPKNLLFKLDDNGNIIKNENTNSEIDNLSEFERVKTEDKKVTDDTSISSTDSNYTISNDFYSSESEY
jgi:hypothetical protein